MGTSKRNRSSRPATAAPARHTTRHTKRADRANDILTNQTDQLYEEARRDPRSDAGCIVRAFVLSGIRSSEARPYEEGASSAAMSRERERQARASRHSGQVYRAEARRARARADKLEQQFHDQEAMLKEVAEMAAKAVEDKLDPKYICGRIADALGLRPPPERTEAGMAMTARRIETLNN